MAQESITRTNAHQWLATAYHEAGHAVVVLQLGRQLLWVEVKAPSDGVTMSVGLFERIAELTEEATRTGRVPAELLRLWREEFWISDAGMVAESEFNLVSDDHLVRGGFGDLVKKLMLAPDKERHPFVKEYFHRHVGRYADSLTEQCRQFFRMPRMAAMTINLAEALLRSTRMEGDEVIDTLLANRAAITGQRDLFWVPEGVDHFIRSKIPPRSPTQLRLV